MAVALAAELFVGDGRNFDVQINAIKQRPADLCEIALDNARRTAAFARNVTVEAARAPVQISTAHSTAFIGSRPDGSRPDGERPNVTGSLMAAFPALRAVFSEGRLWRALEREMLAGPLRYRSGREEQGKGVDYFLACQGVFGRNGTPRGHSCFLQTISLYGVGQVAHQQLNV
jgi:hypothetical protein